MTSSRKTALPRDAEDEEPAGVPVDADEVLHAEPVGQGPRALRRAALLAVVEAVPGPLPTAG